MYPRSNSWMDIMTTLKQHHQALREYGKELPETGTLPYCILHSPRFEYRDTAESRYMNSIDWTLHYYLTRFPGR